MKYLKFRYFKECSCGSLPKKELHQSDLINGLKEPTTIYLEIGSKVWDHLPRIRRVLIEKLREENIG